MEDEVDKYLKKAINSADISLIQVKTIGYLDDMIKHAERTLAYYKQGFLTKSVTELNNVIWHAEVIRGRIKRE